MLRVNTLRVTSMLATALIAVAIVTAALGWPRASQIALAAAVYLLIRSIEVLRASNNRLEN